MIHPRLIVSISCHDLGRQLGCYGVTTVTSPNLDALAHDGIRFARVFCCAQRHNAVPAGRRLAPGATHTATASWPGAWDFRMGSPSRTEARQ